MLTSVKKIHPKIAHLPSKLLLEMSSVVIFYLLYTFLVGKCAVHTTQMRFRDKNDIVLRMARTPLYSPYQSGISV